MKMKQFTYIIGFLSIFFAFQGCTEDERDIGFTGNLTVPSNLSLDVQLAQDNSGIVTLTPSGDGTSLFKIDFGDGSDIEDVVPGSSSQHLYAEGTFTAVLSAFNLNGDSAETTQPVTVSFFPPENLIVTITPVSGDSFSINVTADADFAVGFEVFFGDVADEQATPLMIDETIAHTYPDVGTYELRVVALSGGSETIEVTETVVIDNPIVLPIDFESESISYIFSDFDGAQSAVINNPDPSGVNTSSKVAEFFKEVDAEVFAGTVLGLGVPIDFSEFQGFNFDSWSPAAGLTVKLKLENLDDPNISAEIDAVTTVANGWETLFFDFSTADLTQEYSKVVIFYDFGNVGAGTTYYYDNIALASGSGGGGGDPVELPLDFEDPDLDYGVSGFEGAESEVLPNPDQSGINTSATVVRSIKTDGAQFFAGTIIGLDTPVDFSSTERISIKTWSPKSGIPIRLKLENNDGSQFVELDVNTTTTDQWEELIWDFSGNTAGIEFTKVVIFFEFIDGVPGDGSTYYFDDVQLDN